MIIIAMLLIVVLGICLGGKVKAAYEVQSLQIPINTIINLEDDDETMIVLKDNTFEYELTPVTEGAPLPSSGKIVDGKWRVSVKGDYSNYWIESIKFTKPGIYEYTFKAIPGDYDYIEYDDMVYTIYYDVSNNETYDSLEAKIVITNEEQSVKYDSVSFTDIYFVPEEPPVDPGHKDDPDEPEVPQTPEEPKEESIINTSDINVLLYAGIFVGLTIFSVVRIKKAIKE